MIDGARNITLDRAQDEFVPFFWKAGNNEFIDLSDLDIKMRVEGGFTKEPLPHPTDPLGKMLHFTPEDALSLGNKTWNYMVHYVDENSGLEIVLWRATIKAAGFSA